MLSTIFENPSKKFLINLEILWQQKIKYTTTIIVEISDKPLAMKNKKSDFRIILQSMKNMDYCNYYGGTT